MNKHIQIRNVSDSLHRKLKIRATEKGLSLSAYLLRELERLVAFPTFEELIELKREAKRPMVTEIFAEIRQQGPVKPEIPVADMVRMERENR